MLEHLKCMFRYDDWANRLAAQSLEQDPPTPARAAACMDHILAASWLWMDRITGRPQRMAVWPSFDREERWRQMDELEAAWSDYFASLSLSELERQFSYTNSKGEHHSNSVAAVLWHLPLHSSHHRGQIALLVRGAGGEPAYTDFIQAVRTGRVQMPTGW